MQSAHRVKSPELQRKVNDPNGVLSPGRDKERFEEMREALKESLAEYKIYRPHRAQTS